MLDFLRSASTGWLAKILIGLLVLSFAVWGISGSIIYGNQNTVVQVGDTKVTTLDYRFAYENQLLAFSQQIGRRLSRQEADAFGLRQSVLQQVVAGALLDENSNKMGLGVSDQNLAETIAADPTFNDLSGNFSRSSLRATLRQYGISEEEYIESRKRVALRNQLQEGTSASLDMPDVFATALSQYRNEQRIFEYVEIGPEIVEQKPVPTSAELDSYYSENKARFAAPEYRKVHLIKLQASDLTRLDEVTDDDVRAEYESRKDNLRAPEKRRLEQLVFASAEAATEAAEKLANGAKFEQIVEDAGRKISDISLGTVTKSELPDGKIAEAAFAATLNVPTEVVEGAFGPVILRVTQIEQESTTSFEDIKDQLKQEVALRFAGDRVFELFDAIEDEIAAGEGIVETAKRLDIASRTIDAIDQRGDDKAGNPISGIPNIRDLAAQVFQTEPGDDNEALELRPDGFLWFEVAEIIPEREKPLDEVRELVTESWVAQAVNKRVGETADKIVKMLNSGGEFNSVLAELLPEDSFGNPVKYSTSSEVSRGDQSNQLPPQIVQAGFANKVDKVAKVAVGPEKYAVFKVAQSSMPASAKVEGEELSALNENASQDILSQLVGDLQSRESVSINQAAVEAAFNPHGGAPGGY